VKKVFAIFISLYISLIVFMPKEQILYTVLNQAAKERVFFKIKDVSDYGIYADVKDTTIIYDSMRVANIEDMKLFLFLIYNKISLANIELKGSFKNMLNLTILDGFLTYTVFSPFNIGINLKTTIGDISGSFDIKTSKIKLLLVPNERFKRFKYKRYIKKVDGGYKYESIIK